MFPSKTENAFVRRLGVNQLPKLEDLVAHGRKGVSHIIGYIVVEKKLHDVSPELIWRATSKSISPRLSS